MGWEEGQRDAGTENQTKTERNKERHREAGGSRGELTPRSLWIRALLWLRHPGSRSEIPTSPRLLLISFPRF